MVNLNLNCGGSSVLVIVNPVIACLVFVHKTRFPEATQRHNMTRLMLSEPLFYFLNLGLFYFPHQGRLSVAYV